MTRKETPQISVIVPVYNSEKTLRRCVGSLLDQSYADFEIILVDDGSTDSSKEICDVFSAKDSRVKVLHKPNGGVSSARNAGLDFSSGTYVAFCDSDDCVEKDWLSSMAEYAGNRGLVVCGYRTDGSRQETRALETGTVRTFEDPAEILGKLLNSSLLNFIWNKLFVRAEIESMGLRFDETFKVFEDEYFVLGYLAGNCHVTYVPYIGYRYSVPDRFITKYEFNADSYLEVVKAIYFLLGYDSMTCSRKRGCKMPELPSVIYWYKTALASYVRTHSFEKSRERIGYLRKIARDFHSGALNHLSVRILPDMAVYIILKTR